MPNQNVFQRDLEAIHSFPRTSLMRIVRYTRDEQLYEAVRHELYRRDTGRVINHYVDVMTSDRIMTSQEWRA